MTEAELLALVEEKDPAELTAAEIAALRAAVATSPTVARAVRERVAFDECLFHALGRPNLSIERILARARRDTARGGGRGRAFGLALAIGLLLGVAALAWFVSRPERLVATRDDETVPPAVEPIAEPGPEETAEPTTEPVVATPSDRVGAAAEPAEPTPTVTPAEDRMPWTIDPDLVELAARAPDALLLPAPVAVRQPPSDAELLKWLEPVPDAPGGRPRGNLSKGSFAGLYRLRPPLAEGTALRITIDNPDRLRIHAWNGTAGAMLANFPIQCHPWAAFFTTRKDSSPLATHYVAAARDHGRAWRGGWRAGSPAPPAIDLRYEDGLVTLSHGDVRWLDVPLPDRPTEIYLELVSSRPLRLEMIPAVPLPPLPVVATDRVGVPLAAAAGAEWLGIPPPESGAALAEASEGGVEFTAAEIKTPAAALVRLPPATGPREVVIRVESADVGTGIAVGDAAGKILQVFTVRDAKRGTAQRLIWPAAAGDNTLEANVQPGAHLHAFIGLGTWLKVVECGGQIGCSTSADGIHWVHVHAGAPAVPGSIGSIGPYAVAHPSRRSITIGEVQVGSFPRLAAAADPDVLGELGKGCARERAIELLEATWRKTLAGGIEPEAALALLDEAATLAPVWDDQHAASRVVGWYADLGRSLAAKGDSHPYTAVGRRQQVAPILCNHLYHFFPATLAREEACGHLVGGRWGDLNAVGRRVVAFNLLAAAPHLEAFFDWASKATRTTRVDAWRHPLDVAIEKEAGRMADDIQAAIAEDDMRRGCEAIVAAGADGAGGLVVDSSDADLAASLATQVAMFLRDVPRLREAMREGFSSRATLRLQQALDTGDPALLEVVTRQYPATAPAAEAHLLLGHRSLAAGSFAVARMRYAAAHAADPEVGAAGRDAAATLAAALDNAALPAAAAAAAPVTIGAATLPAAGWRGLAEAIVASRESSRPFNRFGVPSRAVAALPTAGSYEIVRRARMEGDVGASPEHVPPGYTAAAGPPPDVVDWVARQVAVTPAGPRFIVSNRFQVAAHDAATGAVQWRTGLGGAAAAAHAWAGHAMRPVVSGSQVFVRRLAKTGASLVALRLADGGLAWQAKPTREGGQVFSDPVLDDRVLHAVTGAPGISGWTLSLATFSAATGDVVAERELFTNPVNDVCAGELSAKCQLVPIDDSLVVVCAGCAAAIDPAGSVRWVRREPWIPPPVDGSWVRQAQEPPLVHAGVLYVVQPASPAVVAIDAATGRARWKRAHDDVRRVLSFALAGDRRLLVVERAGGITALDAASGDPVWQAELPHLLDGCLVSPAGAVLAAVHDAVPGEQSRMPVLVWIDGATGAVRHRAPLPALKGPLPRLGPLVDAGGKVWAFTGQGPTNATRDIGELTAVGSPAQPAAP